MPGPRVQNWAKRVMVVPMEHKTQLGPGPHTKVKRHADRASYDASVVHAIIDESLVCHVSFVVDGQPFALPTAHARVDDTVYLHGAVANRMCRSIADGGRVCLSFTLLDGLVFARNAFHHSMNYRSVTAFGAGREVTDLKEKGAALTALVDHVAAGRMAEVGQPTPEELATTLVIAVRIEEAAAKVRSGPAIDSPEMVATSDQWAGVVPLKLTASSPLRDGQQAFDRDVAASVRKRANELGAETPSEVIEDGVLYSTDKARLDLDLIHRFLCDESYWAKGISRARVEASIERSLCFGVYRGGAQIGFARVVHDGVRNGFVVDVFVVDSERGHGIGKRLVDVVLSHPVVAAVERLLLGTADAHSLYSRFGFEPAPPGRLMVKLQKF